jgi:hypothetical protein
MHQPVAYSCGVACRVMLTADVLKNIHKLTSVRDVHFLTIHFYVHFLMWYPARLGLVVTKPSSMFTHVEVDPFY